jgi:LysM repeat protein
MKRSIILGLILLVSAVFTPLAATTVSAATICAQSHTVARGETMYRIARTYNTTVQNLQILNEHANANRIYAGQVLCVKEQQQYTVKRGDTLFSIARIYSLNVNTLAQANNISNPNWISVGQVLVIPPTAVQ